MGQNTLWICLAIIAAGAVLLASGSRTRGENGEWSGSLQWGYLLILIGIFGVLAFWLSFTAVLLIFTVLTFAVWLWDKRLKKHGVHDNHFADYLGGYFPIVLIIFVLRTFIAEPFVIPSGSMRPGLIPGDFVLVNKFSYGIRVPLANTVLIPTRKVARGDVAVFNYPVNPSVNYIKRIVGIPGDVVEYRDKVLTINGMPVPDVPKGETVFVTDAQDGMARARINVAVFEETLNGKTFDIYQIPGIPTLSLEGVRHAGRDTDCTYTENGFTCTVPEGKYFALGDNRDNSGDSRYWGFIDDHLMVGKAFLIWLNFSDFSRIGTIIR